MDNNTLDEIFKIVFNYVERDRLINEVGLWKIINIIARKCDIYDFLESLHLGEQSKDDDGKIVTYASYSKYRHNISLYMDTIVDFINNYDAIPMTKKERILFGNLEIISTLLHEVMHAKDRCDFMNKEPNDLQNLLYLSTDFDLLRRSYIKKYYDLSINRLKVHRINKKRNELYSQTYNLNPRERAANIKAYEAVVDKILPLSKSEYRRIVELECYRYLDYVLVGYDTYSTEFTCPTEQYLHEVELDEIWKKMEFYNPDECLMVKNIRKKYSLEDRLEYGLPITSQEMRDIGNKMDSIRNRLIG